MPDISHFEDSMTRTNVSNVLRSNEPADHPTAISQATKRAAADRDEAGMVTLDAAQKHEALLRQLWDVETDKRLKGGLQALLVELTEGYGLGWSDIARLIKVSVPAIRKWRNGGDISTQRLYALGQLAAYMKLLEDQGGVTDPAAWLATPIESGIDRSITKASIYTAGLAVPLLSYADNHIGLDDLLHKIGTSATQSASNTTLVRGEDGSISIVPVGS
ncbi:hypothetical protein [Phytohabitans maris]|uniref:hypothetical protein n=1 Tax=Phytohabitans maris TaxID=3071409 RepID=UPI003D17D959